jgi:cell division septum initiation protein DivIVA
MPIDPEEIGPASLPRTSLGGYKAGPTDELLKRVAWDYGQLVHEHRTLEVATDQLRRHAEELEAQVASLQGQLEERRDPDEISRTLLGAAQRAARELRDSARTDCEAMLKKAHGRASQIEAEAHKHTDTASADLLRLQQLGAQVRKELRSTLDTILAMGQISSPAAVEPSESVNAPAQDETPIVRLAKK